MLTKVACGLVVGLWAGGTLAQSVPPVETLPYGSTSLDAGGTVVAGGVFQKVRSAEQRKTYVFTNVCSVSGNCTATTDVCYLYIGQAAAPTKAVAVPIPAGWQQAETTGVVPTDPIWVTCDSTGDAFSLWVR